MNSAHRPLNCAFPATAPSSSPLDRRQTEVEPTSGSTQNGGGVSALKVLRFCSKSGDLPCFDAYFVCLTRTAAAALFVRYLEALKLSLISDHPAGGSCSPSCLPALSTGGFFLRSLLLPRPVLATDDALC